MICLHLEQKNNTNFAFINSLLHAFFGSVLGGMKEIRRGLSSYKGSLRDCISGMHEQISKDCTAGLERRETDPGCGQNARSTVLEVFNPTATTLGISIPYHL